MGIQQRIADELNVSVATVSRSLRNHPSISAATRARVAETAARMGYKGVVAPQDSTRAGLVRLAALCCGDLSNPTVHNVVTLRIINGMSAAAREHRAMVHIEYLAEDEFLGLGDMERWPPALAEDAISGIALFSDPGCEALAALTKQFACVHLLPGRPKAGLDRVTEDNTHSMELLVERFWAEGHRRFGFVDFGSQSSPARSRFAGFVSALDARGIAYDPQDARIIAPEDIPNRSSISAAHIARRVADGVTAWICTDDFIAYTLMRDLRELGLEVPRDLAIAGFDNFDPPNGLAKVPTIDGPFETLGRVAVERLMQRVANPEAPPSHTMFPGTLIPGEAPEL